MTDQEFDVLDELYFIQAYTNLLEELDWKEQDLLDTLWQLLQKGWIKCFKEVDVELDYSKLRTKDDLKSLTFLATKQGLLKHNLA